MANTSAAASAHGHTPARREERRRREERGRRMRSHHSARPPSPTAETPSVGGTKLSSHCSRKLASNAASGNRR